MESKDFQYAVTEARYEERMKLLKKENKQMYDELDKVLNLHVKRFNPSYSDHSKLFEFLYTQIEDVARKRKESPQNIVDWLFDGLKDTETLMVRLQGL